MNATQEWEEEKNQSLFIKIWIHCAVFPTESIDIKIQRCASNEEEKKLFQDCVIQNASSFLCYIRSDFNSVESENFPKTKKPNFQWTLIHLFSFHSHWNIMTEAIFILSLSKNKKTEEKNPLNNISTRVSLLIFALFFFFKSFIFSLHIWCAAGFHYHELQYLFQWEIVQIPNERKKKLLNGNEQKKTFHNVTTMCGGSKTKINHKTIFETSWTCRLMIYDWLGWKIMDFLWFVYTF